MTEVNKKFLWGSVTLFYYTFQWAWWGIGCARVHEGPMSYFLLFTFLPFSFFWAGKERLDFLFGGTCLSLVMPLVARGMKKTATMW